VTRLDVSERAFENIAAPAETPPNIHAGVIETPTARIESLVTDRSLALPFARISEALADCPAEPSWLVDGFLAPGAVTLLAGRPKAGKSTFTFGLLEAVTGGHEFIGRAVRRAGCLLLAEEREPTLSAKAEAFSVGDVHLLMRHAAAGDWPVIAAAATSYCHENSLGVLVVDTLHAWARLGGDSENAAGAQLEAVEPLMAAAASGLAVLIVVHQRKSVGEHGEAVRGSNALTGAVDIVVELERITGEPTSRVMKSIGRFSSTPAELVVELREDGYVAHGDTQQAREAGEITQLLDDLAKREHASADELAAATGMAKRRVMRRLERAESEGFVRKTGKGVKGDPFIYSFRAPPSLIRPHESFDDLDA
jgi:hypothetical protein